jgi:hypothetical protein
MGNQLSKIQFRFWTNRKCTNKCQLGIFVCWYGEYICNYILSKVCCRFNRFQDRAYTNVDAHELAHQWFGDLITAKTVNIIGYKRICYNYALLAEREIREMTIFMVNYMKQLSK